ncbi:MAG: hypothetical protein ACN6PQ_02120 [Stenotrophomonas indicatrix]|uniref:hypothetical protein n=1 Tax=Stenotrophomonas indicatrix TaxID=2045451 RepID=UPI0018D49236|nr:hypothetical protein [Stenotrophomonas maltophilia]
MALISESAAFGTRVEAIAPRIGIDWNPYTNDGPVTFHFEKLTTQADGTVLERTFLGVLPAKISDLLAKSYVITNPLTGEKSTEPGWKLMAMIKAATDAVYLASLQPPVGEVVQPPAGPGTAI